MDRACAADGPRAQAEADLASDCGRRLLPLPEVYEEERGDGLPLRQVTRAFA